MRARRAAPAAEAAAWGRCRATKPACAGCGEPTDPFFINPILAPPQPAQAGFVAARPRGATSVAGPSPAAGA
jgi:hypothetical protein